MLHNEARELLVEGYEATHNAREIAKLFHVSEFTVQANPTNVKKFLQY